MRQETAPAPVDSTNISMPQYRSPSFPIRYGSCFPATGATALRVFASDIVFGTSQDMKHIRPDLGIQSAIPALRATASSIET